jgi:threonine aldolase
LNITNDDFIAECQKHGLLLFPWLEGHIRAVVHMGITGNDINKAAEIIETVVSRFNN